MTMIRLLSACAVLTTLSFQLSTAFAQGTAFTYQGVLSQSGAAVTGSNDLSFTLYDSASEGNTVGTSNVVNDLFIANGFFTVTLDFGMGAFDGTSRWLQIAARPGASTGTYTNLTPRQSITPMPYAIYAGAASATGLSGTLPSSALAGNYSGAVTLTNAGNAIAGNGILLTSLSTTNLVGTISDARLSANVALRTGGNTFNGQQIITGGNVGIETNNPTEKLHVNGNVRASGVIVTDTNGVVKATMEIDANAKGKLMCDYIQINGGADIAEPFEVRGEQEIKPGMIVAIDPQRPGELRLSNRAYDATVAGIISGANGIQPGLMLQQTGTMAMGRHPVALTGRVWCYSDADAAGGIVPGDMLTTSDEPGHAMKAADRNRAFGAIIGKAMTPLPKGKGLVLVLVSLQ